MTNLEWIRSLPVDRLAEFLESSGAEAPDYCNTYCRKETLCEVPCSGSCKYASEKEIWEQWLKCENREKELGAMARIGKWKQVHIGDMSPGGTPFFACGACGGSEHLHGVEYPRRKVICDNCGRINIYPWEKAYEQESSLWEGDN